MGSTDLRDGNTFQGTAYVQGKASGKLIASDVELSFWGGVDGEAEVIDHHHPLSGQHIRDAILAIPGGRGSCTGSGVMLQLLLNDRAPRAIVFERCEEILTLGVVVAEEMFGKSIPVVTLSPKDFQRVLKLNGSLVHICDGLFSDCEIGDRGPASAALTSNLHLSDVDRSLLQGSGGEAARVAMYIILRMANLLDARELMDVTQVHVDGCVYTGPGCLAFAEKLMTWGAKVRVPTTLNSISVDQKRWRAQGIDSAFGQAATRLADAYTGMGAQPTFTCSPYQLSSIPRFGEQVAWSESNAVVYCNSVLGARTSKYPDFLDICIALTGRAPNGGPHIEGNRLASLVVRVQNVNNHVDDSFFPLLGYHVGTLAPSEIPAIVGIDSLSPSKDDLKAFGAAFATVSSAPMFHIVGVTPEATSLDSATGQRTHIRCIDVQMKDLVHCWDRLNSASNQQLPIDLVSLGNPHFSIKEIRKLASLCRRRTRKKEVAVIVACNRSTYGLASQARLVKELEEFGVQFITDTCWCMISEPIIPRSVRAIATNSGKFAHYGPGLTGKKFYFGGLAGCVDAACQGSCSSPRGRPRWLEGSP